MNKTINISLNGQHFNIDENAYQTLKHYLNALKNSFQNEEGKDEIMLDIETRIAELFQSYLGIGRDVVSEKDVEKMIAVMGRPEQYYEDVEDGTQQEKVYTNYLGDQPIEKKLYRDPDEKIIAGVLAGVSHYFGWNPMILRAIYLGFPLMSIFFDAGISTSFFVFSYIILWIIMPIANTNIQKMQMYGTPVTVDNIQKNFSKEELKETVDNISGFTKEVVSEASPFIDRFFTSLFKILKAVFGIFLLFAGIGSIVGSLVFLFTTLFANNFLYSVGDLIFDQAWQFYLFVAFLFLSMVSVAILFIYGGVRLLSDRKIFKNSVGVIISCFALFFISIIGMGIIGGMTALEFQDEVSFYDKEQLTTDTDTLIVSFTNNNSNSFYVNRNRFGRVRGLNTSLDSIKIEVENDIKIRKSPDSHYYLEKIYTSKGRDERSARENISALSYNYILEGNKLLLPEEMLLNKKDGKLRDQYLELVLYVPDGKYVETENVDDIRSFGNLKGIEGVWDKSKSSALVTINGDTIYCNNCEDSKGFFKDNKGEINISSDDGKVIINEDSLYIESEDANVNIKAKTK